MISIRRTSYDKAGRNDHFRLVTISELSLTDAQLLEQAQQGDSGAWQRLYERLLPSIWRAAVVRLKDRQAAEDVVSETFLALVRNIDALGSDSCRLHGWMLQVVRNKAADWARRDNSRARTLAGFSSEGQTIQTVDPANAALDDERRQRITDVLDALRPDQRLVLELKYADGLSVCEIAQRIGQSEKSIESLLHRSRLEFRRKYQSDSNDEAKIQVDIATVLAGSDPTD
jgi:RNA polymerase sigma-70 factor (ECF subfamily)